MNENAENENPTEEAQDADADGDALNDNASDDTPGDNSVKDSYNGDAIKETSAGVYDLFLKPANGEINKVQLDISSVIDFAPSYNIAPTNTAIIIYMAELPEGYNAKYVFEPSKFGLVPVWAKPEDPTPVNQGKENQGKPYSRELGRHEGRYFNCRRESLEQNKPVWSSAKKYRCVIPIQGYFEWQKGKEKDEKTPYFVHSTSAPFIYLAGFYSHNYNYKEDFNVNDEFLSSFTIVTGPADKTDEYSDISWLHPRKPIFIKPGTKAWYDWLKPSGSWSNMLLAESLNSAKNIAYKNIDCYRVSNKVGNPTNKGKEILKKVGDRNISPISNFFTPSSTNKEKHFKKEENNLGTENKQDQRKIKGEKDISKLSAKYPKNDEQNTKRQMRFGKGEPIAKRTRHEESKVKREQ